MSCNYCLPNSVLLPQYLGGMTDNLSELKDFLPLQKIDLIKSNAVDFFSPDYDYYLNHEAVWNFLKGNAPFNPEELAFLLDTLAANLKKENQNPSVEDIYAFGSLFSLFASSQDIPFLLERIDSFSSRFSRSVMFAMIADLANKEELLKAVQKIILTNGDTGPITRPQNVDPNLITLIVEQKLVPLLTEQEKNEFFDWLIANHEKIDCSLTAKCFLNLDFLPPTEKITTNYQLYYNLFGEEEWEASVVLGLINDIPLSIYRRSPQPKPPEVVYKAFAHYVCKNGLSKTQNQDLLGLLVLPEKTLKNEPFKKTVGLIQKELFKTENEGRLSTIQRELLTNTTFGEKLSPFLIKKLFLEAPNRQEIKVELSLITDDIAYQTKRRLLGVLLNKEKWGVANSKDFFDQWQKQVNEHFGENAKKMNQTLVEFIPQFPDLQQMFLEHWQKCSADEIPGYPILLALAAQTQNQAFFDLAQKEGTRFHYKDYELDLLAVLRKSPLAIDTYLNKIEAATMDIEKIFLWDTLLSSKFKPIDQENASLFPQEKQNEKFLDLFLAQNKKNFCGNQKKWWKRFWCLYPQLKNKNRKVASEMIWTMEQAEIKTPLYSMFEALSSVRHKKKAFFAFPQPEQ